MAEAYRVGNVGGARGIRISLEGTTPEEIVAAVGNLGKVPASAINMPVKKVATKVKNLAKQHTPVRSGRLRSNLVVSRKEHSGVKGKAVFDVTVQGGAEANAIFQRKTKNGKHAYYPASMEYGYAITRPVAGGTRVRTGARYAGKYYMKDAATALAQYHEQLVLDELGKKLDKLWEKRQAAAQEG